MSLIAAADIADVPTLIKLWDDVRSEILALIEKTNQENFIKTPADKSWSISEICEHLYLSQMNVARMIPIIMGKKFGYDIDEQKDLDYSRIMNSFTKPTGIKNPEDVSPLNKYSKEKIQELLGTSSDKLKKSSGKWSKENLQTRGFDHPIIGKLNLFNWIWVMYMHEYSHLLSIQKKAV